MTFRTTTFDVNRSRPSAPEGLCEAKAVIEVKGHGEPEPLFTVEFALEGWAAFRSGRMAKALLATPGDDPYCKALYARGTLRLWRDDFDWSVRIAPGQMAVLDTVGGTVTVHSLELPV